MTEEYAGAVAVGAVAGLVGGNAVTDCACAVAATPANNPRTATVDLRKLDIPRSPIDRTRIQGAVCNALHTNDNCALHS